MARVDVNGRILFFYFFNISFIMKKTTSGRVAIATPLARGGQRRHHDGSGQAGRGDSLGVDVGERRSSRFHRRHRALDGGVLFYTTHSLTHSLILSFTHSLIHSLRPFAQFAQFAQVAQFAQFAQFFEAETEIAHVACTVSRWW